MFPQWLVHTRRPIKLAIGVGRDIVHSCQFSRVWLDFLKMCNREGTTVDWNNSAGSTELDQHSRKSRRGVRLNQRETAPCGRGAVTATSIGCKRN